MPWFCEDNQQYQQLDFVKGSASLKKAKSKAMGQLNVWLWEQVLLRKQNHNKEPNS